MNTLIRLLRPYLVSYRRSRLMNTSFNCWECGTRRWKGSNGLLSYDYWICQGCHETYLLAVSTHGKISIHRKVR